MPPSTLIQYVNQRNLCLEAETRVITLMYYPFIHEPISHATKCVMLVVMCSALFHYGHSAPVLPLHV